MLNAGVNRCSTVRIYPLNKSLPGRGAIAAVLGCYSTRFRGAGAKKNGPQRDRLSKKQPGPVLGPGGSFGNKLAELVPVLLDAGRA